MYLECPNLNVNEIILRSKLAKFKRIKLLRSLLKENQKMNTHCSVLFETISRKDQVLDDKNMAIRAKKKIIQKPRCIIEHIIHFHNLSNLYHLTCLWGLVNGH